jgi:N-acetylglucosaminyl-diphospho-decaprenol L-rhamnosyltransferase
MSTRPDTPSPSKELFAENTVSANARLDVVIVNWNAGALLEECIASVLASRMDGYELGAVVVVDNASTDGSVENVRRRWGGRVTCVMNASNLGFGRACNIGARHGSGRWILLLNPDTRVFPMTLSGALRALELRRHENAGVCGIRLVDDDGATARGCARLPDWKMFVVGALALDRILPRRFQSHIMREWDHEDSRYVDHVIAAFYLVHRSVYERVGGFDERFFVYLEDLDLSQRIGALGFRTFYCAEVHAYHKQGGTSRTIPAKRLFLAQQSRIRYARKHFSTPAALLVSGVTLVIEPAVRLLHVVLTGNLQGAWNVLKAYGLLYKSLVASQARRGPR